MATYDDEAMDQDDNTSGEDFGLFLLVPLYKLLRGNCAQTIFKIVVTNFQSCRFFYENEDAHNHLEKDLYEFLKAIHTKGTNKLRKIKDKDKTKNNKEKQSWQIYNLPSNEKILRKITVKNMREADEEQCQPLKTLDLNFLLNIATNAVLNYPLSEEAKEYINQLKEIRNGLMHAKYNFGRKDFDENLQNLQKALQEIYKDSGISHHDLDMQIEECKRESTNLDASICLQIFRDLQMEIHDKYESPQNFVCPTIREACDGEETCVESLKMYLRKLYLRDHNSKPILLCGKRGSGKTSILQDQAFHLVQDLNDAQEQGNQQKISLVLLFAENPLGQLKKENFWDNVIKSIKKLAPNNTEKYGIETLLVVIKMYIKETIFFVNWTLQDIATQFKETSNGTWIFTYNGYPGKHADWNILITEPLNETQVYQLLHSLNSKSHERETIYEKYRECKYKDVLTTPDMVKIFNELKSESRTEFELMINYVKKKMDEGNISKEMIRTIGKLAFSGIKKNRQQFCIDELKDINSSGQLAFFTKEGNYFELIHHTLMDFLASVYVIDDVDHACMEWLDKDNTSIFKRVFKFACSFWFRDVDHYWKETVQKRNDYLNIIEIFLCKFLSIEKYKTESKKADKCNKMHSCKMEVVVNASENNTNDSMDMEVNNPDINTNGGNDADNSNVEETEMLMSGNPVKNPFSKWGFLVHIDEACDGKTEVLEMLANLLSCIKCWVFKCKLLDEPKRNGVEKILKKVKLNQKSPVTIKIESGPNCNMLINIWNMLKNMESLYNAVKVKISIMHEKKDGKYQISNDRPLKEIVNAHTPVYITELSMPLFSPKITDFKFSMCGSIQRLEYLDANIYDINSLREALACGKLPNMKSIKIYVDLKATEQSIYNPPQLEIPNPKNLNVNLTIVYFKEIQKLLNSFTCRHRLLSLSIHGLVVVEGFKLDFSSFKYMESLYLHCDMNYNVLHKDDNCALLLSLNLTLPENLERLLLSKVQFYNDSNIHLFRNFFAKYNIQRLMLLDSNLSLEGACMVLKQHMFQEKEVELHLEMSKKMKIDKSDSTYSNKVVEKQKRLPKKDREEKKKKKPQGKEIIITSNMKLHPMCNLDQPCKCRIQCTTMLNPSDILKKKLNDLSVLIKDTYCFSILSFAFNNNNVIVRKDLCNDLRVHCPLFKIQDNDLVQIQQMIQGNEIPSNSPILELFHSLTLTQSLYIEKTSLSYDGVWVLVSLLKDYKSKLFQDNEPFSLTVTSDNLPCEDVHGINSKVRHSKFIRDLKRENCLQMLNVWCTCDNRCHRLKKTHDGDIFLNHIIIHKVRS